MSERTTSHDAAVPGAGPAAAPPAVPLAADWSASPLGQILVRLGVVDAVDVMMAAYEQDLGDARRIGEILVARGLARPEDIDLALLARGPEAAPGLPTAAPVAASNPAVAATLAQVEPVPLDRFPTHQRGWLRTLQTLVLFLVLAGAAVVLGTVAGGPAFGVAVYGLLSIPYLLVKLLLSTRYRASRLQAPPSTAVTVVVPVYNEDPATFAQCLMSLQTQTVRPAQVYVVDDGSFSRSSFELAQQFAAADPMFAVHRLDTNEGKRHAQAWGFRQATTSVVVTVDSDTVLHPEALAELVRPFGDSRVSGVCGYARGLNRKRNLLTRLIDLRYTNSFLYERAAYSVLGSVLCSTGVLSAWRRDVVLENIDDYLEQRFMGTEVHYGDDRRLTAYGLRQGRVVLQDSAIALTHVPERLSHFVRQQVRWNKSFFRESLLLLKQSRPTRVAWWLGGAELAYWMVLTTMLLWSVAIRPIIQHTAPTWQYAAFVALMAYARSIRMIGDGGRLLPLSFLLAPVYGFVNLVLLVPLRFYSLLRLRDGSWGTRKRRRGIRRGATQSLVPDAGTADVPALLPVSPASGPVAAPAAADSAVAELAPTPVPAPRPVATGVACVDVLAG